jgi:hypothetical protein
MPQLSNIYEITCISLVPECLFLLLVFSLQLTVWEIMHLAIPRRIWNENSYKSTKSEFFGGGWALGHFPFSQEIARNRRHSMFVTKMKRFRGFR